MDRGGDEYCLVMSIEFEILLRDVWEVELLIYQREVEKEIIFIVKNEKL